MCHFGPLGSALNQPLIEVCELLMKIPIEREIGKESHLFESPFIPPNLSGSPDLDAHTHLCLKVKVGGFAQWIPDKQLY